MQRLNAKTVMSLAAAVGLAFAPAAFAGHGHAYYRGDRGHYSYHGRYAYGDRDGYRGYRHGYDRGYRHYHRDGAGRWIAGAIITGALVGLIADATSPPPPVYYRTRPRVVYEQRAPVVIERRVYQPGTVYLEPGETRYIGPADDDDDGY